MNISPFPSFASVSVTKSVPGSVSGSIPDSVSDSVPKAAFKRSEQPPFTASPLQSQVSPWLASIAYPLAHHLVFPTYFHQVCISGQEHLPSHGPVILAPTHRSRWDGLVVPYVAGRWVSGRDVHFMVSHDEMRGLQGWLIQRLGGFSIRVARPSRESLRHGLELLRDQRMMVIFPEGNIFRDGQVHPLRPGLAHLALQASQDWDLNVQVVPIALRYNPPIVSWGSEVYVLIGSPLQTQAYRDIAPKQAKQQLTAELTQQLQSLSQQLQQACCEGDRLQPNCVVGDRALEWV